MNQSLSLPRPVVLALRFLGALSLTATLLLALVAALGLWPTGASAAPAAQEPAFDCGTVSEIPQAECQALVSLYNNTGGPNWTNRTKWLEAPTPCSWFGVRCSVTGSVIGLELQSNNLRGPLPQELGNLTNLSTLRLSANHLFDPIPARLSQATSLTRIFLEDNLLSGPIPSELANLTKLTDVRVYSNTLSGDIPDLGSWSKVTTLYLDRNRFTGPIPIWLGSLSELKVLSLYSNTLTGEIPTELTALSNLGELNLAMNQLTGTIPPGVNQMTNLVTLDLSSNRLEGPIPGLSSLTNLRRLNLRWNRLTGPIPGTLPGLPRLAELWLDHNALTRGIPISLTNMITLTQLSLGNNPLGGRIPPELGNLTNLVKLYLYNDNLTGTIPSSLGKLTKLVQIGIYMNPMDPAPFPVELTRLTNLTQLWLASSNLTGPIPDLTPLKELTNLHLGNNQLTGPVPNLSGLKKLKWAALGINRLSGSIPASLATLSPTLEMLSLNYNQLTGPVPQELCALTKTMTTTVYIDHNALDLAPAPLCPQVIDPSWTWTQTLPPTDIQATALSTSSIGLSWSHIAYLDDGGGYQVLLSTTRGDPGTHTRVVTDLVKSATGYTVTNLAAGTTYHFAVRTRTPPIVVPGGGYQRSELWSPYSPQGSAQTLLPAAGTLITLKKETETGEPVSAAEVLAYRGAITVAQGTTNAHGQVILDGLQAGDSILARSLQHEQPSGRANHDDWSYRVYLTNLDVGPTGTVTKTVIGEPGLAVTTTLKKDNTLVLFNLVVSTDFPAAPAVLSFLQDEFARASTFLYDVTDGQFALGQVAVYDHGLIDDDDADVNIGNIDGSRPDSKMGGIVATEVFTYTSSAQRQTIYSPDYFRIPMDWASNRPDPVCDGFCRSLIHEFAHYALFLYDEYERTTADGETVKTHCTSPDIQTSTSTQPNYASNASIMYEPYKTSELAMQGTPQWSTFCEDTLQWQIHGESDWETIVGVYADNEESPESPRWQFKTPLTLGRANPGPELVPIDFTTLRIYDAPTPGIEAPVPRDVSMSPGKQMRVFLFSKQHGHLQSIAEVGAPITDTIRAFGLMVGDELKAFTTDGSEYASQTLTSQDQPFVLQPAPWRPLLEAKPDARGEGLELTVSGAEDVSGDLQAMLVAAGGAYSTTTTLSRTGIGEYRGFLPFGQGRSRREGYVWVWGQAQDDTLLEAVTTYRVEGAPGSHEWAYLDWEVGSLDRLLSLSLPENAVPTNTLIIVMPVFTGTWAPLNAVSTSFPQLGWQGVRTFEGTAHRIWASGEMKKRSALTLFYDPTINPSLNSAHLSIYYYNESELAPGREKVGWEEVGGVVDRERHSVSAAVDRFGIYALVKEFRAYLPIIVR